MPYNTVYTFVAFTVPTAANFNNNDANLDFLKTQIDTTLVQGRLTLETGVPVSTTDQTGKTTLYFAPFRGNLVGLKSGSSWDLYSFTELSLALTSYIKGAVYDIFCYLSGGSPTLESLVWKKVTATNSPTSGSSKTINVNDTGDLAVGREVTIKDGTNSEITTIISLVANTSITVDLANSYTTPDIYGFNTRATDLTLDSGKKVKSGDATRRYLGTIRITSTAGQCEDSKANRFVWNAFNRVRRDLFKQDSTATWATSAGSYAYARGQATNRLALVVGLAEEELTLYAQETVSFATGAEVRKLAIGEDSLAAAVGIESYAGGQSGVYYRMQASLAKTPSIGYHFYPWMEYGTSTTSGNSYAGILGHFMM